MSQEDLHKTKIKCTFCWEPRAGLRLASDTRILEDIAEGDLNNFVS